MGVFSCFSRGFMRSVGKEKSLANLEVSIGKTEQPRKGRAGKSPRDSGESIFAALHLDAAKGPLGKDISKKSTRKVLREGIAT